MVREAKRKKTIQFNFSEKHKEYIRQCEKSLYNVAEGAVRAGKTVDNVFAFAHELKTAPDRIHLATGSTVANAKLNIGDSGDNATGENTRTMKLFLSKARQQETVKRLSFLQVLQKRIALKKSVVTLMGCG